MVLGALLSLAIILLRERERERARELIVLLYLCCVCPYSVSPPNGAANRSRSVIVAFPGHIRLLLEQGNETYDFLNESISCSREYLHWGCIFQHYIVVDYKNLS